MPNTEKTILVVHDSRAQRNLLTGMLRHEGLHVLDFEETEKALETLQKGVRPDLIVSDLYMPGIDGWRFCRLLRSPEYQSCNQTPILVVSSTFSGEEAERITTETGANGFLSIPSNIPRFVQTVHDMLQGRYRQEPPRVLIVEDGKTLANLLRKTFQAHSYRTDIAVTYTEALDRFKTRAYDVAIIDYHLPDGQGDGLLEHFARKRPDCVCLVMTSDPQPGLALECMKKGAAAYLRKPFSPDYAVEICAKARRERTLLRVEDRLEQRTRELRESEERFQVLFQQAPDPLFIWRLDDTLLDVNERACLFLGYSREELLRLSLQDIQAPCRGDGQAKTIREELTMTVCEGADLRKDGATAPVEIVTVPITLQGEVYALSSVRDISERKRTEEALRASEERARRHRTAIANLALDPAVISGNIPSAFARLTETASATIKVARAGIWLFSRDGTRLECISLFETQSGRHGKGAVLNTSLFPSYFNAIRAESRISIENALTDPRTSEMAKGYLGPLGITSMLDAGIMSKGELVGLVCLEHIGPKRGWHLDEEAFVSTVAAMAAQILASAERKEALMTLQRREEQYRELFEDAPVGIFQTHPGGRFLSVNPMLARLAGYEGPEEMVARITDIAAQLYARPEERILLMDELHRHGHVTNYELEWKRLDGEPFWVSLNVSEKKDPDVDIVYSGFLTDITQRKKAEAERRRLEAQLRHAHKMEAVGTLAGGIAHDFNNILQGISGYTHLLLARKNEGHPDFKGLTHIHQSCERAKSLIRQLLAFSRKMEGELKPMDLNQEVLQTHQVLMQTIPRMIDINLNLNSTLWPINADPVQVQQILLNLCGNAADAMPGGGRLTIETANITLDTDFTRTHMGSTPGNHVLLAVSDTGCGMDKATQAQIFDPFFTTKEVGKGTGLGLASVYGVVKAHGGSIYCTSQPGQGATFRIYWPASKAVETPSITPPPSGDSSREGTETILVVDDEDVIRELVAEALESNGYEVLVVSSGEEALDMVARRGEEIDLILMDLNMPGMGGQRCMEKLLDRDRDMRILISSGYTSSSLVREILQQGASGFLAKPYQIAELMTKVREIMDGLKT